MIEPLLAIDYVIYDPTAMVALVKEDAGDRVVRQDGLDKATTVHVGPDRLPLEARFQVHLPISEDEQKLVDRPFAEIRLQRHHTRSLSQFYAVNILIFVLRSRLARCAARPRVQS